MVVGLLFGGLTIRYLGTARAGYLMLLVALTGFGSLLGDFGFGTAAVQRVAALCRQGELGTSRHIVSSVVTLSTVSAMVTAVPVVLFHARVFAWSQLPAVYRTDSFWATIFAMVTYVLTQATGAWRSTYTSLERFDISSGLSTTFGILNGTAGIIVLHICPTMAAASFVRLVTSVIRVGTDAYFAGRLLRGTPWPGLYWREVKPLIGFGMWIYASNVGNFFLGRVNSFILTTMLGASALPFYEFPQRIYLQVHGALNNQSTFLFPMFASYGGSAAEEIEKRQDRLRWILAVISGAAYVAIALLGVPILRHLVNAEFAALARWCLILACVQGFFEAQTIVPSSSSWALGAGQPNAIIEIIRGVLVAVTAWLLIPRIGYNGAAIAQ
ncbi:MAG: oligosaccharide flippase family protein, partial [Candidatus Korobacteraceae bacterium]